MQSEKIFRGLVEMFAVMVILLLSLGLAGCSAGELKVDADEGSIAISASSGVTGKALTSIEVEKDADIIDIAAEIESGTITIAFDDGSSGRVVLDANSTKHESVSVEAGTYAVTILAEHATGKVDIRTAMVLDGDGTAGS